MSTTEGWLKLNFASCVIRQTRSLGVLYTEYYIVLIQDFTLRSISGLPTVRGTAGLHYITRRVPHSSMLQYFQVRYSGYTLSPRCNWPSVIGAREKSPNSGKMRPSKSSIKGRIALTATTTEGFRLLPTQAKYC